MARRGSQRRPVRRRLPVTNGGVLIDWSAATSSGSVRRRGRHGVRGRRRRREHGPGTPTSPTGTTGARRGVEPAAERPDSRCRRGYRAAGTEMGPGAIDDTVAIAEELLGAGCAPQHASPGEPGPPALSDRVSDRYRRLEAFWGMSGRPEVRRAREQAIAKIFAVLSPACRSPRSVGPRRDNRPSWTTASSSSRSPGPPALGGPVRVGGHCAWRSRPPRAAFRAARVAAPMPENARRRRIGRRRPKGIHRRPSKSALSAATSAHSMHSAPVGAQKAPWRASPTGC